MSNIKTRGKEYLKNTFGFLPSDPLAVSKYYNAEESWTKKPTWWFDLDTFKMENAVDENYYLVGEKEKDSDDFIILKVPNEYLMSNYDKFETKYQGRIRLHITAAGDGMYIDERGVGKIDFSGFVIDEVL